MPIKCLGRLTLLVERDLLSFVKLFMLTSLGSLLIYCFLDYLLFFEFREFFEKRDTFECTDLFDFKLFLPQL